MFGDETSPTKKIELPRGVFLRFTRPEPGAVINSLAWRDLGTWRMGFQWMDTWLIDMVIVSPLRIGLWDPLQMAVSWLTNGCY